MFTCTGSKGPAFLFVISFAILEQSRVILSQAGRAHYIMICINPAFTQKVDQFKKIKLVWEF